MKITPIKTSRIEAYDDLFQHLKHAFAGVEISKDSIIAISSKIISLCEGSVIRKDDIEKDELIKKESDAYVERSFVPGGYVIHTMKNNMVMPSSGIDASNTGDYYALLPRDSYLSAVKIHEWVKEEYQLNNLGIIIVDSRSTLLRRGVVGYALGYYGFNPIYNYRGKLDLYGRTMHVSQSNIPDSLAAAAVLVMGEGNESTPLAIISDIKNVEYGNTYNIHNFELDPKEDIYMPFYKHAPWKPKK